MSLLRKLAGETMIYGFSSILSRILHYVLFTLYLTHVFNAEMDQYGIYRDLYFYVALVLVFLTFRMETTYFRFAKEDKPGVTMMSMFFLGSLGITFLLLLYLFRTDVAALLKYDGMSSHLMLLGGVLLLDTIAAVPFASLRQQNRPWRFLLLKLGAIIINIVIVLFFLEGMPALAETSSFWQSLNASHDQLYFIFLGNLIASGFTFIFLLPVIIHQPRRWDTVLLKRMLKYSWPLVLVAIAGVINQSSATTFQKLLLDNDLTANLKEGGIYAAAASLAILLNLFTVAFNFAAEPFFFAHKDAENSRKVYADVALAFTLVGALMMLGILAYMDVIQYFIGENARAGLEVVPILLLSYLLLGIYYNLSTWYKLADKTLWGAWIAIGGVAITVVGNILLLPVLDSIGSAWAALICYLFMCIASYVQGQKYFPIPYAVSRMVGWILCALILYGIMVVWQMFVTDHQIAVFGFNTLLLLVYVGLVFRFEKALLMPVLKRGGNK